MCLGSVYAAYTKAHLSCRTCAHRTNHGLCINTTTLGHAQRMFILWHKHNSTKVFPPSHSTVTCRHYWYSGSQIKKNNIKSIFYPSPSLNISPLHARISIPSVSGMRELVLDAIRAAPVSQRFCPTKLSAWCMVSSGCLVQLVDPCFNWKTKGIIFLASITKAK